MKKAIIIVLSILYSLQVESQVIKRLEKKVERRVEQKVDRAIDRGLDKVEDGISGKNKKTAPKSPEPAPNRQENPQPEALPLPQTKESVSPDSGGFSAQSKFDFIPGEKLLAFEDFAQDLTGDFPDKWNTDASGEIVTLNEASQKWLAITGNGALSPDFIKSLPDNFTLEFDVAVNPEYSYYDAPLLISMAQVTDPNGFSAWKHFGRGRTTGTFFSLHPQDTGNKPFGRSLIEVWENGSKTMENKRNALPGFNKKENPVHVAVWRQKQRLRVYVGEHKIWDIPKAFSASEVYNSVVFSKYKSKDGNYFYITNLRLAAGAPDTRNKLLTEGKFSTTGIYFNSGSALIKPESHGILQEIAKVLNENPSVKVHIVGHTDQDGTNELNLRLSKQRAEAVKMRLFQTFGIALERMTADGKGATEPVSPNTTPEGKAQNRRVEFVKTN